MPFLPSISSFFHPPSPSSLHSYYCLGFLAGCNVDLTEFALGHQYSLAFHALVCWFCFGFALPSLSLVESVSNDFFYAMFNGC
ncbi:hypothetical protein P8452_21877 [Trifolium repens]|nr:hypothetical protein P8452_21877 [Trifolium repens]